MPIAVYAWLFAKKLNVAEQTEVKALYLVYTHLLHTPEYG